MKLLILIFPMMLLAADGPTPKPLPDKDAVAVMKAQNAVITYAAQVEIYQLQLNTAKEKQAAASKALADTITAVKAANGCANIIENPAEGGRLECVPPAPKAEKKEK